jgi:hypothetical protein
MELRTKVGALTLVLVCSVEERLEVSADDSSMLLVSVIVLVMIGLS